MKVVEDVQIEQAILGGLIIEGICISKDELTEENFSSPIHYELYNLIFELYSKEGLSIDQTTEPHERFILFANFLEAKGILERYRSYLPLLAANAVPSAILPMLVQQVKRKTKAKEIKQLAQEIVSSKIPLEEATLQLERLLHEYKQTSKSSLKKINIYKFMTEEPPKIDYVFGGLPVSSIGILASPGGLGKSMFVLQLLTAVATGKDITDGAINTHGKTGKCTYICLEDPEHVIHYRIWNLIAFLHPRYRQLLQENLSIYTQREIFEIVDAQGIINQKNLDEIKKIAEGQRLIVVDTLRRVHSADENKAGQMSTLLQAFEVIAKETGTAVLLVHHTGKNTESKSRGSSVLYDNVRYQINLEAVPEKEARNLGIANHRRAVRLVNTKSNYGPLEQDKILYRIDHGILRLYDAEMAADF